MDKRRHIDLWRLFDASMLRTSPLRARGHVFRLRRSAEWTPWPYPHGGFFAACHGVLTSHALPCSSWGPSLRAIASLLQAKHMPPRSGLCKLSGRAARHAEQRGDGRAKAERLTVCVKNLFFPDTFPEERASFKRSAFSSFLRLHKKGKIDSAAGHRAALPGHPRLACSDVSRNTCLPAINGTM